MSRRQNADRVVLGIMQIQRRQQQAQRQQQQVETFVAPGRELPEKQHQASHNLFSGGPRPGEFGGDQ